MGFAQRRAFRAAQRSAMDTWAWLGLPRPGETGLTFEHVQKYDPSGQHPLGALLYTDHRVAWRAGPYGQTGFDLLHGSYTIERLDDKLGAFLLTVKADESVAGFQPAQLILPVAIEVEYLAANIAHATGSPWKYHEAFVELDGLSLIADPSPRYAGLLMAAI